MDTRGFNERDITESLDKITNAIKATGGELPPVTSDDDGKILKVVNGDWNKGAAPTELPEVSGTDNGKILTVTEGAWTKGDAPTELPAVSSTDNGKILKVTEGVWAKGDAPSGPEEFEMYIRVDNEGYPRVNKTVSEVLAALNANKRISAIIDPYINNFQGKLYLTSYTYPDSENDNYTLGFCGPMYGGSDSDYLVCIHMCFWSNSPEDPISVYLYTKGLWELFDQYEP